MNQRGGGGRRVGKPPVQVQSRAIRDAPSASRRASEGFRPDGAGYGGWRVRSSHPAGLLLRSGAGNLDRKLDLCPAEPGQRGGEAARSRGSQRGRGAELRMTNMFSLIHSFCFSSECLFTPRSPTVLIHFSVISLVCLDSSGRFIDSIVIGAYQQKYSFTPKCFVP